MLQEDLERERANLKWRKKGARIPSGTCPDREVNGQCFGCSVDEHRPEIPERLGAGWFVAPYQDQWLLCGSKESFADEVERTEEKIEREKAFIPKLESNIPDESRCGGSVRAARARPSRHLDSQEPGDAGEARGRARRPTRHPRRLRARHERVT